LLALLDTIGNGDGLCPGIIAVQDPTVQSQKLNRRAESAAELRLTLEAVLCLQLVARGIGTPAVTAADDGLSVHDVVAISVLDVEDGLASVCELGVSITVSIILGALLNRN
jgi:hypothetical protein